MFSTIISVAALKQAIDADNLVILDCRFDLANPEKGLSLFQQGHIAGAQYIDLNKQLSAEVTSETGRHPLPESRSLLAVLQRLGICSTSQVVVYDDCSGAIAARAWWLLRWLGHEAVAVLDGGITTWQEAGLSLTTDIEVKAKGDIAVRDSDFEYVTTAQVSEGHLQLIDARAEPRFQGQVEPIDPIAGHIEGALNRPFQLNLTAEGVFNSEAELMAQWQSFDSDRTAHMCGSGVTACHNILAMCHAGFAPTALYVGSWSEWIRDSQRPVATS